MLITPKPAPAPEALANQASNLSLEPVRAAHARAQLEEAGKEAMRGVAGRLQKLARDHAATFASCARGAALAFPTTKRIATFLSLGELERRYERQQIAGFCAAHCALSALTAALSDLVSQCAPSDPV
eukprot:tig00020592_g11655.t1